MTPEPKPNRGVANPTSAVVGTASAFLAFISSGSNLRGLIKIGRKLSAKRSDSLRVELFYQLVSRSLKNQQKARKWKGQPEAFSVISLTTLSGSVIRFFHGIFFPSAHRLMASATSTRDLYERLRLCLQLRKKNIAVGDTSNPTMFSFIFIATE